MPRASLRVYDVCDDVYQRVGVPEACSWDQDPADVCYGLWVHDGDGSHT